MLASNPKRFFIFCSVIVTFTALFSTVLISNGDWNKKNTGGIHISWRKKNISKLRTRLLKSGQTKKKHKDGLTMTPFQLYTKANRKIVFYNRMPKCGSRTMLTLFGKMNRAFKLIETDIYNERKLEEKELNKFVHSIKMRPSKNLLIERHFHFVNFEHYGLKQPIYINLIREPFEQALSRYYFHYERGPVKKQLKGQKIKTFEECVRSNLNSSKPNKECFLSPTEYVRWFCGHEAGCSKMDYGLERAKQNIDKYYLLIGLTEEYAKTLQALEMMLPSYFKGMGKININATRKNKVPSSKKIRPSENIIKLIKERFRYNYDIYNFVTQKFYTTLKSLGIQ